MFLEAVRMIIKAVRLFVDAVRVLVEAVRYRCHCYAGEGCIMLVTAETEN